jgi:flavorubredoxin
LKKVLIVYDSKYGNTKLAAENILTGLKKIEGIETAISYVKDIEFDKVTDFGTIILGAPNHMGRPSRTIKGFVNKLADLELKTKNIAIFDTYSGKVRAVDRAVKKLVKIVENKLPNLHLISPTLSVRVKGIKGPIVEDELPKCIEFGKKIASQIE